MNQYVFPINHSSNNLANEFVHYNLVQGIVLKHPTSENYATYKMHQFYTCTLQHHLLLTYLERRSALALVHELSF